MKPLLIAAILLLAVVAESRGVTIPTVPVGNPGNAHDPQTGGLYGGVSYEYRIGTTEVTNSQYAEFLNAIAAIDPLGLYSTDMGSDQRGGILRSGLSGSFSYVVRPNMGDKPVNFVDWYDAIRFANWINNGQGTSSTESGSYTILGGTPIPSNGISITRNAGATWVLPTQDEWHKAAFHQPAAAGGDSDDYWLYATRSNTSPIAATANATGVISNPGGNVVNYKGVAAWNGAGGNLTTVGSAGPASASFYGTFDQNGNVGEWIEDSFPGASRGVRGGSFGLNQNELNISASHIAANLASLGGNSGGFRLVVVPEPSTYVMAAMGIVALMFARRRMVR